MKLIITSVLLFISVQSIAKAPKNVECIKKQLKQEKTLEEAYQICSIKK
jgi:hypothetical protein